MKTPHKHAELIKAWADGAEIQAKSDSVWLDCRNPEWWPNAEYRIKPEPQPDKVVYPHHVTWRGAINNYARTILVKNKLKLVFDGETGELKSAEVL